MMRTLLDRSALVLVLVLVLETIALAKETNIKIATVAPEGTPWYVGLSEFDKELREVTKNQLGLKVYPGGVQGDEKVCLRKMKAGQLQACALTGMGLGEVLPWVRLLELPFQYRSGAEVDFVRGKLDERVKAEFQNRGYVLIGWSEVGTATLYSNRKLMGVEDVRASKPWLWEGDPLAAAAFQAFGVNPTPLQLPDVLTSLQTGLIDTVYSAPTACIGLQWHTKLKYRIDVPLSIATGGTLVSKGFFDKLPEDQRKTLLDLGAKYEKRLIEGSRKDNAEGIVVLKDHVETLSWPAAEVAKNEEIGRKVSEQLAGEGEGKLYSRAMLDEVMGYLKEYRAAHPAK